MLMKSLDWPQETQKGAKTMLQKTEAEFLTTDFTGSTDQTGGFRGCYP